MKCAQCSLPSNQCIHYVKLANSQHYINGNKSNLHNVLISISVHILNKENGVVEHQRKIRCTGGTGGVPHLRNFEDRSLVASSDRGKVPEPKQAISNRTDPSHLCICFENSSPSGAAPHVTELCSAYMASTPIYFPCFANALRYSSMRKSRFSRPYFH